MKSLLRTLLVLTLVWPFGVSGQTRLPPVDEAVSVADFFSFRAKLQVAVARRDVKAVLSVLSKDVKLSFGGDGGVEEFKTLWKPHAPDSELWGTLASILSLGGTFESDGSFTAPYVFTQWPQTKDPFKHMLAIGSGIRVRSSASAEAPVISALDFSVVELAEAPAADATWVKIKLSDGRTGFVGSEFLRSPIDYRISFAKQEGRWQVVYFLAGD
jgi:hypothetical protein